MTNSIVEGESTLTDYYQTTIPKIVRKALRLQKQDKIHYAILDNGKVVISRITKEKSDPAIDEFLKLLAKDIQNNPENLQAIDKNLVNHIQSLMSDIELDLDAPLSNKDK